MEQLEYARMALKLIPDEIIAEYNLRDTVDDDRFVSIMIMIGMYGLPQAGILANKLLTKRLEPHLSLRPQTGALASQNLTNYVRTSGG